MSGFGVQGTIGSISVKWMVAGSANPLERYGIVANSTISRFTVGGKPIPLPWLFGNVQEAQNWR